MTAGAQEMDLLSAEVVYWAAAGAYWCFPPFFLCAYSEQVVSLLKNSGYHKRKKLAVQVHWQGKSKGSPGHFSMGMPGQMLASLQC